MIAIMASIGNNNEIGKENELIWKLNFDLKNFKKITENNVIVMGRNTFNLLPQILPNRKHIVLSTTKKFNKVLNSQVIILDNVIDLVKKCRKLNEKQNVYIIGGESMYRFFIDYAEKMYITKIEQSDDKADAFFPKIEEDDWNKKVISKISENGINAQLIEYTKK